MDYSLIEITKESRPDKFPCSELSETAVVRQNKFFEHEDLYVDQDQTFTANAIDRRKFKKNTAVRAFLLCAYMISLFKRKVQTVTGKDTFTLYYNLKYSIVDKLQKFFPDVIVKTELKDRHYDFVISERKTIDERLDFHYGMFILKINESSLFNFYLGTMLVAPWSDYYDNTIGFLVRKSTTKIITYETKYLTEFIEKSKQKQVLYNYFNPFMGKMCMDLLPGVPCYYNNMYTLFVLRLIEADGIYSAVKNTVSEYENIEELLRNFSYVFEKEDTGFTMRDDIPEDVRPARPEISGSTHDATVLKGSTINMLNSFYNDHRYDTIFLFHSSIQINALSTPMSFTRYNYKNVPIDMMRESGNLFVEADIARMRENLTNSTMICITYGSFMNTIMYLSKMYQRKKFPGCSLRFCENIVFCNAEYITQEMFVCHAALHNLKRHGALLPDLYYQVNSQGPMKISDFSLGFDSIALKEVKQQVVHEVRRHEGAPIQLNIGNETSEGKIKARDISEIYYKLFATPDGSNVVITTTNVYVLGFIINNVDNVVRRNAGMEPKTQINFNLARSSKERIFIMERLIETNIQPVELTFLNTTNREAYIKDVRDSVVMKGDYIASADLSTITLKAFAMWPLFSKGFYKAVAIGTHPFMFCVFAAIYQDYEEFVIWGKRQYNDIPNITEYEMKMIYDYFEKNNGSIIITDLLETFCKNNRLNYDAVKKILIRLTRFCAQKHTKYDPGNNFAAFIGLLKTENILGIEAVEVGGANSRYILPHNKQFLTYNKVIPISYVEMEPSEEKVTYMEGKYAEAFANLDTSVCPPFMFLVYAALHHDAKNLTSDPVESMKLVYEYIESNDRQFTISQNFDDFCDKHNINRLLFKSVIQDLDSFCNQRSVIYDTDDDVSARMGYIKDLMNKRSNPPATKIGSKIVAQPRRNAANLLRNLVKHSIRTNGEANVYRIKSFVTLYS